MQSSTAAAAPPPLIGMRLAIYLPRNLLESVVSLALTQDINKAGLPPQSVTYRPCTAAGLNGQ